MKVKLFLASLAVAGLAVSSAVAAPPEGKGKPKTGEGGKPKVTVVLKGTLTGAPLQVDATSSNRWGRAYVPGPAPTSTAVDPNTTKAPRRGRAYVPGTASTSIAVDPNTTKVRRRGKALITELVVGDRVLVQARVCKADLEDNAMPPLTASRVVAHPAKTEQEDDD